MFTHEIGSDYDGYNNNDYHYDISNYNDKPPTDQLDIFVDDVRNEVAPLFVLYCVLYLIVFVVGLLGNAIVTHVVRTDARMHTNNNMLIVNLAVCQILELICCTPVNLVGNYHGWPYGWFLCKLLPYLNNVFWAVEMFTIAFIAFERFLEIFKLSKIVLTTRTTLLTIAALWIVLLIVSSPYMAHHDLFGYGDNVECSVDFPSSFSFKLYQTAISIVLYYFVPAIVIIALYSTIVYKFKTNPEVDQNDDYAVLFTDRITGVKLLICSAAICTLLVLPIMIAVLENMHAPYDHDRPIEMYHFLLWVAGIKNCVHPIVYCVYSASVREAVVRMASCGRADRRTTTSDSNIIFDSENRVA